MKYAFYTAPQMNKSCMKQYECDYSTMFAILSYSTVFVLFYCIMFFFFMFLNAGNDSIGRSS